MGGKLGRLPNDPSQARLRISPFFRNLVAPASVNWDAKVSFWPMYGNDLWGDCVFAMIGHGIQILTANAGTEVQVSLEDVLRGYSDVTGFDRHAGPPGQNPTDQGTVIQDALNYWRKTGIGGHKILAFAEVDYRSEDQMQQASAIFGMVLLGINFPASAMDQFDRGEEWDVVFNDGGNEGGHAIVGARYDQAGKQWYWITWAREHPVSFAFITRYLEEAWVVASQEWVDAISGKAPSGLDWAGLNAAFTELTGDAGPFPNTPQPPVDPPVVPPLPSALGAAVQSLLEDGDVAAWVHARHNNPAKHVAKALAAIFEAAEQE